MAYESLGAFVRALRDAGELATIDAPVDPRLEIAEITDRVVKAGGPALLFRSVRGSRFPVLTNAFGTQRRTAMAFGAASLGEVEERLRRTIDLALPPTLGGKPVDFGSPSAAMHAGIAYLPEDRQRALLVEPLVRFTDRTITDVDELLVELEQVRLLGYATAFEELEQGLIAVASPIRDLSGNVVASLSASGPVFRLERERIPALGAAVRAGAEEISRRLGSSAG